MNKVRKKLMFPFMLLVGATPVLAADTYDDKTWQLTIPLVQAYGNTYKNVLISVGDVLAVNGGTPQSLVDTYDAATNRLTIPSVVAFGTTYTNVVVTVGGIIRVEGIAAVKPALTSYENKNLINIDSVQIPSLRILKNDFGFAPAADELAAGCLTVGCTGNGVVNDRSLAFGDFFQDGSYAAFITTWRKTGTWDSYLINRPIVDAPNRVYFVRRENGRWIDKTAQLLPNVADRYTCISHSYTSVADFNGDGKPDLFVSCHGIDFSFGPSDTISGKNIDALFPTTWRNIMFEEQILFLSQADGTYRKSTVPGRIYGHHASAADINGDGKVDAVTVNASWGNANSHEDYRPFFLINNGDGTFTKDYTRLPTGIIDPTNAYAVGSSIHIYWAYLIPIDGRVDLILVGDKVAWYKNPGNGNFSNVTPTFLPLTVGYEASPLDIVYKSGYFYVNHSGGAWPGFMRVKKISATDMSAQTIYTLDHDLGSSEGAISPQFKFTVDGTGLVPFVAGCEKDASDPAFNSSKCSIQIPIR